MPSRGGGAGRRSRDPDTPSLAFFRAESPSRGGEEEEDSDPPSPSLAAAANMPDALLQSPCDGPVLGQDVPSMILDLPAPVQRQSSQAPVPEGPSGTASDVAGGSSLLSSTSGIDADEEYSRDEKMLNEFTKFHPMTSLESTSVKTMQLVAGMTEKAHVIIPELPSVPKTHDDKFLSPANHSIGERDCVCGPRCLAMFIARVRYGPDNTNGFVCKEFLLPDQHRDFLAGKGCPPQRQKCLLCSRYFLNYVYILARTDPSFKAVPCLTLQTFSNPVGTGLPDHDEIVRTATSSPTHSSLVACKEGYKPHAMLFVDEDFANQRVQRETSLGVLSFRPVVRFCSTHYRYTEDADGKSRIVQIGIGCDEHLGGLGFRQPPPREATAGAASRASVSHYAIPA